MTPSYLARMGALDALKSALDALDRLDGDFYLGLSDMRENIDFAKVVLEDAPSARLAAYVKVAEAIHAAITEVTKEQT